jgi:Calcineurin-like phosphoesterase
MNEIGIRSRHTPVITPRSLPRLGGLEAAGPRTEPTLESASRRPGDKFVLERYQRILETIERETEEASPNVLVTVQDREVSLLQSKIAEDARAGEALEAGGYEAKFGEGPTGGDLWGWFRSLFDHIDRTHAHAIMRPPNDDVGSIKNDARIALVGDWGTNLYGAPVSADTIKQTGPYDLLLHLGDIYYSGTKTEVQTRFLDVWPKSAAATNRALNGNHEMYSGGFGYFDEICPAFGQASSYFAFQNDHWLLIGLDTAYVDHDLDAGQLGWLNAVIQNAGGRKIVLFSHHQPFSRLGSQGPNLAHALSPLLTGKAFTAWYWGHEHECIVYDRHTNFGLSGRCIGHGGIPSPRKAKVLNAPSERISGGVAWKRFSSTAESPSCLLLDGPNPYIKGEEDMFGPHGYATLQFEGPSLIERIFLPGGSCLFENQIT